jgi:hypothetical protein
MSETTTQAAPETEAMKKARLKKISLASFGGGRKPSPEEQKNGGAFIGTIAGVAEGGRLSVTTDSQSGEVKEFWQIYGKFEAEFADKDKATVQAGILYLPGGFHEAMLDAVAPFDEKGETRKDNGNQVRFEFDVFCVEAPSQNGWAYQIVPVMEKMKEGTTDPVAEVRAAAAKLREQRRLALAAPAPEETAKAETAKAETAKATHGKKN